MYGVRGAAEGELQGAPRRGDDLGIFFPTPKTRSRVTLKETGRGPHPVFGGGMPTPAVQDCYP
ncbi:hypothetical protein IscW_ISCW023899 [Ixodes scapularis]|uniref:Uncharacterized protein n=1 Tax=Ixodes scapularis TaxID=6945 RepID=B7QN58_IXOSC|nr:hypothetical protein IscW_ISCW023899 [Ixodes scapularis]|eukprot:XP_002400693.1 hypothetical protein IscW_ISCW023899 [Ixodes scapularis]